MLYAEVVISDTKANINKTFTYGMKEEQQEYIYIGCKVIVPLGQRQNFVEGIVIEINNTINFDESKLKFIRFVLDGIYLNEELVKLGLWIKDYYLSSYGDVFKTISPTGLSAKISEYIIWSPDAEAKTALEIYIKKNAPCPMKSLEKFFGEDLDINLQELQSQKKIQIKDHILSKKNIKTERYLKYNPKLAIKVSSRANKQIEALNILKNIGTAKVEKLLEQGVSKHVINELVKKECVEMMEERINRYKIDEVQIGKSVDLNKEQQNAYDNIETLIDSNKVFLLHGITGSGKTEVYMEVIESLLLRGKSSIVLVPEISLTPQTVERFAKRFGENIAVLHSRLSAGEKYDQWCRIESGEAKIVIGARSAIFAPVKNLGLIVLDEEHDSSYKSSMAPRYDTREVAIMRAKLNNASVVMGSATPSIESYFKALGGNYKLLELKYRAKTDVLPKIDLIDMRQELEDGNKSFLSRILYKKMKLCLDERRQIILFLNRRGYSSFVSCRKCGYTVRCDDCDISMTHHMETNRLHCHYCGRTSIVPRICPECGSPYIKAFGIGTQKVEEHLKFYFPGAVVSRMDADTTKNKGSHEKIFKDFKNGNVDILIGTQMITKGLDVENVSLVGVLAADLSLNMPDYKAAERSFQLMTQVGGRAGRGAVEGSVVIQTYQPDHYSLESVKQNDYRDFYEKEIRLRRAFEYPPFTSIVLLLFSSEDEKKLINVMNRVIIDLKEFNSFEWLGPTAAPISKINRKYRYQILVRAENSKVEELKNIIKTCVIDEKSKFNRMKIQVTIDINPNVIL